MALLLRNNEQKSLVKSEPNIVKYYKIDLNLSLLEVSGKGEQSRETENSPMSILGLHEIGFLMLDVVLFLERGLQ